MRLLVAFLVSFLTSFAYAKVKRRHSLPSSSHFIVGGQSAPAGRYPYFAGLKDFADGTPFCGGGLIAPNVVLTAAHCGIPQFVNVGCQDFTDQSAPGCELFGVAEYFAFLGFDDTSQFELVEDYAVIVLDGVSTNTPMDFLASADLVFEVQQLLTVIGVGATFTDASASPILLQVDVGFVPPAECDAAYFPFLQRTFMNNSMLCASSPGKDSCQSDSGGPLVLICDATGQDLQVGIVSFGLSCAAPQYPGVYAKVSAGFDFINDIAEAQGHSPNTITSLDEFCRVEGTQTPTAPSPPPTVFPIFPSDWRCNPKFYSTFDGCNCECGAVDPDCDVTDPPQQVLNCQAGQTCEDGKCVGNTVPTPTSAPVLVPENWQCSQEFFSDGNMCDCNCGFPDPDCEFTDNFVFGCPIGQLCLNDTCVSEYEFPVPGVPPGWICLIRFFEDGVCDCDCGFPDPDCQNSFNAVVGCLPGQLCVDDVCVGNVSFFPTLSPIAVPPEWTCPRDFFGALDGCDCECGFPDPDCETQSQVFGCEYEDVLCIEGQCVPIATVTVVPTVLPTTRPLGAPVAAGAPTFSPSFLPTDSPTSSPTSSPVAGDTDSPTPSPVEGETEAPTDEDGSDGGNGGNEDDNFLLIILTVLVVTLLLVVVILIVCKKKGSIRAAEVKEDKVGPSFYKVSAPANH